MSSDDSGYDFGDGLPIAPVAPGSSVLVSGEQFSRADDLARSMVLDGQQRDEGSLFITTNKSYTKLLDACRQSHPALEPAQLRILDCTGQDMATATQNVQAKYVSTQSDLTGIGMKFSALYESLYENMRNGRIRVGLSSLSSLAMYVDLRTLFRFAQTLSGRIESADGLGVFTINPSAHDSQTVSTLSQVADGKIEVQNVEEGDEFADADGKLRVRGLRNQSSGWQPFTLPHSSRE
jgi:KaiC/GvpD/RAD55 family RecA-like ATPase